MSSTGGGIVPVKSAVVQETKSSRKKKGRKLTAKRKLRRPGGTKRK